MCEPDGPCGCGTPAPAGGFLADVAADLRVEYGDEQWRDALAEERG
jgi:hypothetical protein